MPDKTLLAWLVGILIILNTAIAADLTIVTEDFPPYNYEINGEARGLSTEVVQKALEYAGLEAEIEFYPWARAYQVAQRQPNTLIYSIAFIPEREPLFEWIGVIAPYRTSFYKMKSNTDIRVSRLEEAKSYQVGVSHADVIETYLRGEGFNNLQVTTDDRLNVRMLYFGRLDMIAYDEASFPRLIKDEGLNPELVEREYRIKELTGDLYMAIHPDSDPELIRRLKEGLQKVRESGDLEAIQSRYFLF